MMMTILAYKEKREGVVNQLDRLEKGTYEIPLPVPKDWERWAATSINILKEDSGIHADMQLVNGLLKDNVLTIKGTELRIIEGESFKDKITLYGGSLLYTVCQHLINNKVPENILKKEIETFSKYLILNTVAHEYCHVIQRSEGKTSDSDTYDESNLEIEANQFGEEFALKHMNSIT
jgi:hypothetical protein